MLKHLLIKNYVLIQELEINPSENLNIITGETGAGKSIMLGALGLLMGNRAESRVFFDDDKKCVIEGSFDVSAHSLKGFFKRMELDYEPTTIIRREMTVSGKSRAFINDTPVNLEVLKKIGVKLMDIHSQHDTQMLGSPAFQLRIVDAYAQNDKLLNDYQKAFNTFKKAQEHYETLLAESQQSTKEHDFNLHLLEELEKAKLADIQQKTLEEELEVLENAETIKNNLNQSLDALNRAEYSAEIGLQTAEQAMQQLAKFSDKYAQLKERISSMLIEMGDVVLEVEREESDLFFDHERIQDLQDQLDNLYSLQKKHQVESVEALIAIQEELQLKVDRVLNFDEEVATAQKALEDARSEVTKIAEKVTKSRLEVIPKIEEKLDKLLSNVGIPNGQVSISHQEIAPSPTGADDIQLLFSANKGIKPAPLKNVASGGEFSRLMLCIKYVLASKVALPTIIFDEIDTGVSGEVAIRVGKMLQKMAKKHQLMAITHLPQIAAKGQKHYYVFKDNTHEKTMSLIKELTEEERISEIAQMIGGNNPTATAYQSAKELMAMG